LRISDVYELLTLRRHGMRRICRVKVGRAYPLVKEVPEDHHFAYQSVINAIPLEEGTE
jgi:hypothetical protein